MSEDIIGKGEERVSYYQLVLVGVLRSVPRWRSGFVWAEAGTGRAGEGRSHKLYNNQQVFVC